MLRAKFLLMTGGAMLETLVHAEAARAADSGNIEVPPNPLHGVIAVVIDAKPLKNLLSVSLWVDKTTIGTDVTAPWAFVWDTTTVSDGSHVLRADAIYANRTHTASRTVIVNNKSGTATIFPSLTLYPSDTMPVL